MPQAVFGVGGQLGGHKDAKKAYANLEEGNIIVVNTGLQFGVYKMARSDRGGAISWVLD